MDVYCVGRLSSCSFQTTNEQDCPTEVEERTLEEQCAARYKYTIIGL